MNLVADESVDGPIVVRLRQDGHTVDYIAELASGMVDERVLSRARERDALLITADKDFGELVFMEGKTTHGHRTFTPCRACADSKSRNRFRCVGRSWE